MISKMLHVNPADKIESAVLMSGTDKWLKHLLNTVRIGAYCSITLAILNSQIHLGTCHTFKHANPRADFMHSPVRFFRVISQSTAAPIRVETQGLAQAGGKQDHSAVEEHSLKSSKQNKEPVATGSHFSSEEHCRGNSHRICSDQDLTKNWLKNEQ